MENETMEMGESTDTIHREIAASREAIVHELATTNNDWYACFISRLTVVKGEAEFGNMSGEISDEKFNVINGKIDALTAKVQSKRKQNPGAKDAEDGEKEELFAELEAIGQGL